jgi:hypothetical protein
VLVKLAAEVVHAVALRQLPDLSEKQGAKVVNKGGTVSGNTWIIENL